MRIEANMRAYANMRHTRAQPVHSHLGAVRKFYNSILVIFYPLPVTLTLRHVIIDIIDR
jgi:hypothetical protein